MNGKLQVKLLGIVAAVSLLLAACSSGSGNGSESSQSPAPASPTGSAQASQPASPANFNQDGFPITQEKITLKIMGAKAPIQGPWDQLAFFKEMEKRTNVALEFDTPPMDSFNERMNLSFATNSLPDFIFGSFNQLTAAKAYEYGSQGFLVPLEDLIGSYAPNVKKLLDDNPDYRKSLTSPDGHIYTLPRIEAGFGLYWPKFWINQEWLDELNLQTPKTLEELAEVLKAFQAKDGSIIPMTSQKLDDIRAGLMNAYGYVMDGQTFFAIKEDKVVFVPAQEEFKAYLTFLNGLYADKLLDSETFTQTRQQMQAKGADKRLGFFFDGADFLTVGNENSQAYTMVPPLTTTFNADPIAVKNNPLGYGTFAITKENDHPEATIRWVDYLFGKEGAILHTFGLEGEHWESTPDGGIRRILPEGANQAEFTGQNITPDVGATRTPKNHTFIDEIAQIGEEQNNPQNFGIRKEVAEKLMPHVRDGFPILHFTEEEQKERAVLQTDITTYMREMEAKFVIGAESLDKWDGYLKTMGNMQVEQLTALYQQAYDRWKQQ